MRIIEVGPRDGLQNERTPVPTDVKISLIASLFEAGLNEIEATSFVSPKWVPQLADAADLWPRLPNGPLYSALVPNQRGLDRAIELGVQRIAVFTAASDAFTQKNINMTVEESLVVFKGVVERFRTESESAIDSRKTPWIRGYVSTAFECPYAGRVDPSKVVEVVNRLWEIGCDEISIGDTIGAASPREVKALCAVLNSDGAIPVSNDRVAWHFHDTNGTAVANIAAALDEGAKAFDSSAAGLGGCPYAPGAGGNLATEDLVYFLEREGIATGIDLDLLARASEEVLKILDRSPTSKAQLSRLARQCPPVSG